MVNKQKVISKLDTECRVFLLMIALTLSIYIVASIGEQIAYTILDIITR